MGIIGKINQDNIEFVRLRYFINVLNFSVSGDGFSGFYILPELLDKGLSLHYRESGSPYDQKELKGYNEGIKQALSQVSDNLFDTDEPVNKIYQNALIKTLDNAVLSLWNLYVKRSDIEKIYCSVYDEYQFPWPLVFEPLRNDEWALFPDVVPVGVKQIQVIQTYIPIPDTTMPVVLEDANTVSQISEHPTPCKRRIKQIDYICKTTINLGFNPMDIPITSKAIIKAECLKNRRLFSASGFDHAWKKASNQKIISIQNKEKFQSR